MVKGIYLAARGMQARMKNLEVVANNLANLNTTGFKEEMPFSMIMNQYGKVALQQNTNFEQGNLMQTSNPLDMGISGNGYFVVQTENGTELTRNGNFLVLIATHSTAMKDILWMKMVIKLWVITALYILII